jgi:hypothetical protein
MSRKGLNAVDYTNRNTGRRKSFLDDWDDYEERRTGGGHAVDYGDAASSYDKPATYSGGGVLPRCYESHPPLKLPGTEFVIYGGSCSKPIIKDADIYIGFDSSMRQTSKRFPWKKGEEVRFLITDMSTPDDPEEFRRLVEWTKKQLAKKAKIHAGCIGGHGRTGTFLAALVSHYGEKDAIEYVRQHYCQKAVESAKQVDYLNKHFGIKKAQGYKTGAVSPVPKTANYPKTTTTGRSAGKEKFTAIAGKAIW